jgi:hypothetical protein
MCSFYAFRLHTKNISILQVPLICAEIEEGKRAINTNLGLKGGKRMRSRK